MALIERKELADGWISTRYRKYNFAVRKATWKRNWVRVDFRWEKRVGWTIDIDAQIADSGISQFGRRHTRLDRIQSRQCANSWFETSNMGDSNTPSNLNCLPTVRLLPLEQTIVFRTKVGTV
jgi:hypothetical protein